MTTEPRRLALAELHEQNGAEWGVDQGVHVPGSYGDITVEVGALRQGCALWDGSAADGVEMWGEDRHRFLNAMLTADVLELAPGSSRYGLFANIKGRVMADVTVIADDDRIWLRLPPGRGDEIRKHMEQYIITDRVELSTLADEVPIVLAGPLTETFLAAGTGRDVPPVKPWTHTAAVVLGHRVRLLSEPRLGTPAISLWASVSAAAELINDLLASAAPPTLVGLRAMEAVRVEAGIPRYGIDFAADSFPQEADLDCAVSYEKGCYLGQEVVARIHFRGGVNRLLRGLGYDAAAVVEAGEAVLLEGSEVGHVTSAPESSAGAIRALALLKMSAAEPGARLTTEAGVAVEVVALPSGLG